MRKLHAREAPGTTSVGRFMLESKWLAEVGGVGKLDCVGGGGGAAQAYL